MSAIEADLPGAKPASRPLRRRSSRVRIVSIGFGVALAAGAGLAWWISAPRPVVDGAEALALDRRPGDAAHGAQVFAATNCASCHASPGQANRLRLGGGLAIASPIGPLRAPNISPDPNDGIGRWRPSDIVNAVMAGVGPDGRHYYPALPYTSYAHLKLDDAVDLVAYLRTLPPVAGRPPPHEIAWPFRWRRTLGLWKALFLDRSPIVDDPARSTAWNRGRYLVEANGHCAECHSSRNPFGAIRESTRLAGGPDPEGAGYVPNLTPTGLGRWQPADIARVLREGRTPDLRQVGSSMRDVVINYAKVPESDRDAIAVYLKSLPARPTPQP